MGIDRTTLNAILLSRFVPSTNSVFKFKKIQSFILFNFKYMKVDSDGLVLNLGNISCSGGGGGGGDEL